MCVKFSRKILDNTGNTIFDKHKIRDIDVDTKGEEHFWGFWFTKDDINESVRSDGSMCIAWEVEYFGNLCDLKALSCVENDCHKVEV